VLVEIHNRRPLGSHDYCGNISRANTLLPQTLATLSQERPEAVNIVFGPARLLMLIIRNSALAFGPTLAGLSISQRTHTLGAVIDRQNQGRFGI
jgi:hypothetical protein